MSTVETVKLKDYTLYCGARAVDSGSFMPTLMVASNIWPSRPRIIAVQGRDFLTEAQAVASAHEQGLAWVGEFGARRQAVAPEAQHPAPGPAASKGSKA
jgi:hypothetical protein